MKRFIWLALAMLGYTLLELQIISLQGRVEALSSHVESLEGGVIYRFGDDGPRLVDERR